MTTETTHQHEDKEPKKIEVTINGKKKKIAPGAYIVSNLKRELGVSADLALSWDVGGTLTELADDATITVKEDDAFFSGPRTGGSSNA